MIDFPIPQYEYNIVAINEYKAKASTSVNM